MRFVLRENKSIERIISKISKAKSYGMRRIAEIDMLLSLLLMHLEKSSNYFEICKEKGISPYGVKSREILISSVGENFEEKVDKNISKVKKGESKDKEEELFNAIRAFVKFRGKIKKNFVREEAYINKKIELSKEEEKLSRKIFELVNKAENDLKSLISDAFLTYYDALREKDNAFSFFRFWIVVEMLIKAKQKLSNKEVLRRASLIYNKELYGTLDLLSEKRNKISHSRVYVSQDERNLMKSIAETVILFVLSKLKKVRNLKGLRVLLEKGQ